MIAMLLALSIATDPAALPAPLSKRVDLRALLASAILRYPEMAVVAAEREGVDAITRQAYFARWSPRLDNSVAFGMVPGARGDIFESPDSNRDVDDFGPYWRARMDFSMPLLTFGRMSGHQRAARALLESKDAKAEAKRTVARELGARAYYGWLAAHKSLALVREIRGHLDRLVETLEHPGEGDPEPDVLDVFKARSYAFVLDRLDAEAARDLSVAAKGIAELVDPGAEGGVRPAADDLVALDAPEPDLPAGIREAMTANAELREAESSARALNLLADAIAKEALPLFEIGGLFEYSRAPGRDEQQNPFIYQPYNMTSLSAELGLRWDINFKQVLARSAKERAEAHELVSRAEAMASRLRFDVTERHAHLMAARATHESSRRAMSYTANWLRVAEENHGLGTASVKDLVDAYRAWVETRAGHLKAVHDLNLALIAWRLALGRDALEEGENP